MRKHLKIKIYGRVQGVFFRVAALEKAIDLGIRGFIRNEPDQSIYIEAEAEKENLAEFLKWCKKGPELASVRRVEFEHLSELRDFEKFSIK